MAILATNTVSNGRSGALLSAIPVRAVCLCAAFAALAACGTKGPTEKEPTEVEPTPPPTEPGSLTPDDFRAQACALAGSALALKATLSQHDEAPGAATVQKSVTLSERAGELAGQVPADRTDATAVANSLSALSAFEPDEFERRGNVILFADDAAEMGRLIPCPET